MDKAQESIVVAALTKFLSHCQVNLLNLLGKSDKMQGLPSILLLIHNKFNKFNKTEAQLLDSILKSYDIKITLKSHFLARNCYDFAICTQCYGFHFIMFQKYVNH